jgi:TolA-binding protein
MKKIFYLFLLLEFVAILPATLLAQKTMIYDEPKSDYDKAYDLFVKEKYSAAQIHFDNIYAQEDKNTVTVSNAQYYAAICAFELFNRDAEQRLLAFVNTYPESSKIDRAYFVLGKLYYRDKHYRDAIKAFNNTEDYDLTDEEKDEYHFKLGYSYFKREEGDLAKTHFEKVKDHDNYYTRPALYYYSHIEYNNQHYDSALKGFLILLEDETFGSIAPYYVVQIYYIQKKYDELLKVAPPLLEKSVTQRKPEIARIIGEAHYYKQQYTEAIPYLEQYRNQTAKNITADDRYQLAYAYYRAAFYEKAILQFQKVAIGKSGMAQNAYYHMAGAYLKLDKKEFAMNSFFSAYQLEVDEYITEDALFNYAKLAYELSYNPFNEAINAFNKYIKDYPKSDRIDAANEYLVNLYMTTKNYKRALESIQQIENKSPEIKEAYQKVAYFYGVELFNQRKYKSAITYFKKSNTYYYNKQIRAQSFYWQGDAYYRINRYDSSAFYFQKYLTSPGAFEQESYNMANYHLGYAYFKMKDYEKSLPFFQTFTEKLSNEHIKITNDAYLRLADCYYVTKRFSEAIIYYDKSLELKQAGADYAILQKSVSLGVLGKFEEKTKALKQLLLKYPESHFMVDAVFELAITYMIVDNNQQALSYFDKIINEHPNSSYVKKAKLKTGMIYNNQQQTDKALDMLTQVVKDYQGTPESKEALNVISNIYVELNQVDKFIELVQSLSGSNISEQAKDTLMYIAAENNYMKGDCVASKKGFTDYLNSFPRGVFAANAHFYRGECEYDAGNFDKALVDYKFILAKPFNKFTETSVENAARIYYDKKQWQKSLELFKKLEEVAEFSENRTDAQVGQLRCYAELEECGKLHLVADKIMLNPKLNEEIVPEVKIRKARCYSVQGNTAKATALFNEIKEMSSVEYAAEAIYNLALMANQEQNYVESEQLIFDMINEMPSQEYWIAKSFLILADNYVKTDNVFQAKHTLEGIISNYEGEGIVKEAKEMLEEIEKGENQTEGGSEEGDVEINMGEEENNQLFE